MRDAYHRFRRAVGYVAVEATDGTESIGTAFHIGQGYFVTAKHVVDEKRVLEVCLTQPALVQDALHGDPLAPEERPKQLTISEHVVAHGSADVAVFRVSDYEGLPAIPLNSVHDIHRTEDQVVLSRVICLGYPPIPLTVHPFQVVVDATVSALVKVRGSDYLTYVVSATARGGFSGGPVLDEHGNAIALVAESLVRDHNATETGYMACLSTVAAADLAISAGWDPEAAGFYSDSESLMTVKLALQNTARLNPHTHDARIYVYDDDRDVFVELAFVNADDRKIALDAFDAVCPVHVNLTEGMSLLATPLNNPSARLLVRGGRAARDALERAGYSVVNERIVGDWE